MKEIDKILKTIEEHIQYGTYAHIESDNIELKDLSGGNEWKELYKTVCAFLNTRGGIILIGIKEDLKNRRFEFKNGFNPDNEARIKQIGLQHFKDYNNKPIDLTEFIKPSEVSLKPFLSGQVCLVYVEKLPDDLKYVFYENVAYERQLTGDHRISDEKIKGQDELRETLRNALELSIIPNATINNLDVDKLNEYIQKLNKDIKVETLKPDIGAALPFMTRRKFVRDNSPTLLGILVCGAYPESYVESRCQVDCYVDSGIEVANDKKVYKDNIIPLMESSIAYVFSKTGTGISIEKGGTTLFEYPERVIRETVNNALAHRDYSINKFVNINIVPNKHIEIRNPGRFKQEQIINFDSAISIRRIIPKPIAQNPNLADVLKAFDRWEGKGWGMSTLTNFALSNQIDVPYYRLYSENDIGLFITKGRVLDDEMNAWLDGFSKYITKKNQGNELTIDQKTVLSYFYKSEKLNRLERFTVNLSPDNNHFVVIKDLEDCGLITKLPDSPRLSPIYMVDRTLTKKDFYYELNGLFETSFENLAPDYKKVLNAIYLFSEYSNVHSISANTIGHYLYIHENINLNDLHKYEQFKRKVRNIINKLEAKEMIVRKTPGKPNYTVNKQFKKLGFF